MPDLPVDILFGLIEDAAAGERPDFDLLWAFYSTCRTLRAHSQKFLFRKIRLRLRARETFSNKSFKNMFRIFLNHLELIVEGNPDVAACVKTVEFKTSLEDDLPDKLIALLNKFKNLRELQCGQHDYSSNWADLSDGEKRRWETVLQLPPIQILRIFSFRKLPVSVLLPHAWLAAIHLDEDASIGSPEENIDNLPHLPMQMASIQADCGGFDSLGPLFEAHPAIGVPVVNERLVSYLFLACITDEDCGKLGKFCSLQSLALDISEIETTTVLRDLHPDTLLKLSWLGLTFWLDITTDYYPELGRVYPSTAIGEVGPTGFPALRRIQITLVLRVLGLDPDFSGELGRLDQLLGSSSLFPVLQQLQVDVEVTAMELRASDAAWLRGHLEDVMPLVTARPGCKITSSIYRSRKSRPSSWR
ncbi:hypothetical protein D9619_008499 [Psilocybe cf. subviscida]|uniref:Uncharacterized protein n=1 Tax=Psilocybe cf. subviscida TaxID=2480587 RepID=A0A8H5F103_9AGAR|nr:hypothetical protein D9619_008499 [Psilocybe cf. subviscida]